MVNNKVHVCIIDNGIFCKQIHLYKNMEVAGNKIKLAVSENDRLSHGSACANVIEANIEKSYELSSITILDLYGKGEIGSLLLALEWCKNNSVDIINLSLGSTYFKDRRLLQELINECAYSGLIIVAALSNAGFATYPAGFTNVVAVRKSDVLKRREYKVNYNTGLGFGIVETYGSDTVLVDGKMHETRASNSIATPYVTSKIADIYFKGITPFYIRSFFSQEQIDINCFYVDWIRTAYFSHVQLPSGICSFCVSDDLDSSDTVILGEMDYIEHYLDAGKNIIYLGNDKLEMTSSSCYIWSGYNRERQIELNSYTDNEDVEIPVIFVKGCDSLNKVRELCRKMIEQDYNAYGITGEIAGELIGLRYIPIEKKKGNDIKKYICSEIFYGQYDILICDLGSYSKEDIQTEICIEPDVYIYADDAEICVYSEEESKVFKEIRGIPEQYIIELLTRE
ncbi:MAG: hypothetical protein HFG28_11835 [Eubacterium sp.]|nr:hypothetical protein [Eubacterium sp.]